MADTWMIEDSFCNALLQYQNTPSRKDGLSPARKLYGRPIPDTLPAPRRSFSAEWQSTAEEVDNVVANTREKTEGWYNLHAWSLPDTGLGSSVAIQNPENKVWDLGPYRR